MTRRRQPGDGDPEPIPLVAHLIDDAEHGGLAEIRRIQPFQARKHYLCPGCNQEIRPGTGHIVVVPLNDPRSRRHWHTPCFARASAGSAPRS